MDDYLNQIEMAAKTNGLYYLSLGASLTIPDICGALESTDGIATGARYKAWFDANALPPYRNFLSGEDCYRFRCSFLHQGTTGHPQSSYSRIVFIEPGATGTVAHLNVMNDALKIDVKRFTLDMVVSAKMWLACVKGTEPYESNLNKFVRRYPQGLAPYIVGVPVIS